MTKTRAGASRLVVGGLLIFIGIVLFGVGPAEAHTPVITDNCRALTVSLTAYNSQHPNHVTVTIDSATVVDKDFGSTFNQRFAWSHLTKHTWHVVVVAWDSEKYNVDQQGTDGPCKTGPSSPPPTSTSTSPTSTSTSPTSTSTSPTSTSTSPTSTSTSPTSTSTSTTGTSTTSTTSSSTTSGSTVLGTKLSNSPTTTDSSLKSLAYTGPTHRIAALIILALIMLIAGIALIASTVRFQRGTH